MGGRGGSGALAGGCGAFGLVGLLLGVGLTVFLASRVMSSVDGGGKATTTPTLFPTAATLDVAPAIDLEDRQVVVVTSADFRPDATVTVSTCLAPDASVDVPRCDDATAQDAKVGADGHLELRYRLHRRIDVGNQRTDCAESAGRCVLRATPDGGITATTAPLSFRTTPPG